MKYSGEIHVEHPDVFERLAAWASHHSHFAFYVDHLTDFSAGMGAYRSLQVDVTGGAFAKMQAFHESATSRLCGYLGYDLKNELEALRSENPDVTGMPLAVFFEPELLLQFKAGILTYQARTTAWEAQLHSALASPYVQAEHRVETNEKPTAHTSREAYVNAVKSLQKHIQRGDIYEANYCMQFSSVAKSFDPLQKFLRLQRLTEAPFSVFARFGQHYILSASPERFLRNRGGNLLSQPIKGTIKRSNDPIVDARLSTQLREDAKEQSENVMIVDLVRNDLSRVAARGSVQVEELFGMYPFKTVHHMVSSVVAQLRSDLNCWDAIKACFPMGSMTGAPKISAMQLIESHESFRRGAYSGAFGWIDPQGDYDFNVLIRTLFFDRTSSVLSFAVGSAITIKAEAEKEYDECLLKAQALMQALNDKPIESEFAERVS